MNLLPSYCTNVETKGGGIILCFQLNVAEHYFSVERCRTLLGSIQLMRQVEDATDRRIISLMHKPYIKRERFFVWLPPANTPRLLG